MQWEAARGFAHPKTGEWLSNPAMCLKGWLEPDPGRRAEWVQLIAYVEDYLRRRGLAPEEVDQGQEVVFD